MTDVFDVTVDRGQVLFRAFLWATGDESLRRRRRQLLRLDYDCDATFIGRIKAKLRLEREFKHRKPAVYSPDIESWLLSTWIGELRRIREKKDGQGCLDNA